MMSNGKKKEEVNVFGFVQVWLCDVGVFCRKTIEMEIMWIIVLF
jgi:hypothetical protein